MIGAFATVTKGLLKVLEDLEVGGRVETIQTTTSLRTPRILRRVLETWGDLLSLRLQWKPSAIADVKSSNEGIIIIIIIIIKIIIIIIIVVVVVVLIIIVVVVIIIIVVVVVIIIIVVIIIVIKK